MSETLRWIAKPDPGMDGEWVVLVREGDDFRAVAVSFGFEHEAKMAAAAPDLYEAADDVDVFVSRSELEGADERVVPVMMTLGTIRKFRAALAKVEGVE